MTFNQHLNSIQTLINTYNLQLSNKEGNDEIRGNLNGRIVLITIRYATQTIYWTDTISQESKTFRY